MKTATVTVSVKVHHSVTAEALREAERLAFSAAERALAGYVPSTGGGYISPLPASE